ncbi:Mor transcription activator family protein [Desulfocurvibacter africanus]|uniref:Uncharacterized protein n=1 Tax=Desulfocurvibacter africanus subsp. africanus str. Walvis Bay TaxID=690850 RepID=F3YW00_DESAF|nr:Mor transcription activator family protein [Desulfocurvibacter africanus]EGJ49030.1 hypothetical protein Desaf_0678 [Desulfocurvibacter africanus subsp. africanus str. Walvis Bay]
MTNALRDAPLSALPESLRDMVDLIGLPAALKLVERWGGITAVYVPKDMTPGHDLARELGYPAALKLSSVYGGDCLRNIPRCAGALRAARDRQVLRLRAENMAPRDIAPLVGLTERWVWEILNRAGEAERSRQIMLPGLG